MVLQDRFLRANNFSRSNDFNGHVQGRCRHVAGELRLLGDALHMRYFRTAEAAEGHDFGRHFIDIVLGFFLRYLRELFARNV